MSIELLPLFRSELDLAIHSSSDSSINMSQGSTACGHNNDILWNELRVTGKSECSICLETTKGDALQHKECSLKACRDCLMTWLSDNFSCPNCRRKLRMKCRCNMTDEEEMQDIHDRRRARIQPTRYYVAESPSTVRRLLKSHAPEIEPFDFWEMLRLETEDTHFVMESEGVRNLRTLTVQELIQQKDELGLSKDSFYRLWFANRIMGATVFYLTQFDAYPHFGFWQPVLSTMHCLQSPDDVSLIVNNRDRGLLDRMLASSMITQIPLSTAAFTNIVRSCDRIYPDESQHEVREIYESAERKGITHWALIDLSAVRPRNSNYPQYDRLVWVVPWPKDKLTQGFRNLEFPGLPRMGPNPTTGWAPSYDQDNLTGLASLWQREKSMNHDAHAHYYYGELPVYIPIGSEYSQGESDESVELDYA